MAALSSMSRTVLVSTLAGTILACLPAVAGAQQLSRKPRHRVLDAAPVVDAGFEQQAAGADRLGVFRDERPLLRGGQRGQAGENGGEQQRAGHGRARGHSQNVRRLSTRMVTGPSLTSSTCIIAWNSPVLTGSPADRNSLTKAS